MAHAALGFFPGLQRPGREVDHSPPPRADVENEWSYTSIPYMLSWPTPVKLHIWSYLCFRCTESPSVHFGRDQAVCRYYRKLRACCYGSCLGHPSDFIVLFSNTSYCCSWQNVSSSSLMNSEEVHKQDTVRSIAFLRVNYGDGISSRTAVPCCNWCHYQPV